MAAPKGNQYAKGNHNTGRPRKYDLEAEAKALKEWARQPDTYILRLFAAIRDYPSQSTLHEFAEQSEVFSQAFEYARTIIGARREQKLIDKDSPEPFRRYATVYDHDLKQHEIEMKQSENQAREPPEVKVRT